MEWQPIETMPLDGEFLAENNDGDWLKVERYDDPFGQSDNSVIHRITGRWWYPDKWMPLPKPPEGV